MGDTWAVRLLAWYRAHRRAMPWRDNPDPYAVWLSEIMLQQTQVDTVIPYFERFLARFPTIRSLAEADEQEVLRLWQGLGYYSRARRLQATAQALVRAHAGRLPDSYEALLALPGFGPYTAAAVASIVYAQPVPVVDGNVLRVFARYWGLAEDIAQPKTRALLFDRLLPAIAPHPPADFNQAIMELGALVCRPSNPDCLLCPLQPDCVAANTGRVAELPVKSKRKPIPHHQVAAALVWRGDAMLVVQRPAEGMLGGMWELPGGRQGEDESLPAALLRHVHRATGLLVEVGDERCAVGHTFSHFSITVHLFEAICKGGDLEAQRWLTPGQIPSLPFSRVTLKLFQALRLLA